MYFCAYYVEFSSFRLCEVPPEGRQRTTQGVMATQLRDLRRHYPRYDDWHREGMALDATMPPLPPDSEWLPREYLEKLRRRMMVLLHDGGAPADLVEADQITTALRALGPRNPPVALTAAPRDPHAACAQFEAEGYLYFPAGDLLGATQLAVLQDLFATAEPAARERWNAEAKNVGLEGLGHTGRNMIDVGDTQEWASGGLLQSLLGSSTLPATLREIFGSAAACRGAGARILPPERSVEGAGAMGAPQG